MEPLTLSSFPRANVHIDGDAFFASCEQSRRPKLQGRPVVTGKERGIAASMSYEAKARGVTRGMRLADIRKICPEAVILPSDYETYSLLSKRFFAIVRRYTPDVEEYSIDECFADLTGLRRPLRMSYLKIAERINPTATPIFDVSRSGFRPTFGDMPLWNILASCAVILYTSPYPYVTNVRLWAHGRSVASQPASMEGGTCFHLDTGHHRPDSLVTGCHRAAP